MAPMKLLPVLGVALVLGLALPGGASAAWTKPGKCMVPSGQRSTFEVVGDATNNRFSTTRIPCFIAAYAIEGMFERGSWTRSTFRYTATGARWIVKLKCRSRIAMQDVPQPGRVISCTASSGTDAETNRSRARSLKGGTLRWTTNYTG